MLLFGILFFFNFAVLKKEQFIILTISLIFVLEKRNVGRYSFFIMNSSDQPNVLKCIFFVMQYCQI